MSIRTAAFRVGFAGVLAAASLATLAAPAHAAGPTTAFKSGNILFVTAAPGTVNNIAVVNAASGPSVTVTDTSITAGAGCTSVASGRVSCSTVGVGEIRVSAGDLGDRVSLNTNRFARVLGGSGDDVLNSFASLSSARLSGNDGNDRIQGFGFESLFGQNGNDTITGGDFASGGDGTDFLTGNNFGNTLVGNAGFDVLDGRGGQDLCLEGEVNQNCEDLTAP